MSHNKPGDEKLNEDLSEKVISEENTDAEIHTEDTECNDIPNENYKDDKKEENSIFGGKKKKIEELNKKIEALEEESAKYMDLYQRAMAEFDNYKKRTIKEREVIKLDAKIDVISKFLTVLDNIERAEKSFETEASVESLKQGVNMVFKQILDIMESEGVESIKSEGEEFDPEYHNAVMHIEDDKCDINVVVEEFQKGYKCKDKVIRHSMVKVAN